MTELQQKMKAAYDADPTIGKKRMVKATGCGMGTAQRFLEKIRRGNLSAKEPPPPQSRDTISEDYRGNTGEISVNSLRIKTLDEALKVAKVDLTKWEVERYTVNSWEVTMKGEDGPEQATNHQVKVWLRRLTADIAGFAKLFEQSTTRPPCQKNHLSLPTTNDPHMLEISLMDHHFGKLAWRPETGSDYDLKIAATLYRNAIRDLVAKASTFGVEKILLPLGQDFFNIDSNSGMTTAGTPQDCDGRLAKIFEVGQAAVVDAIEMCARVANVEVVWVPGNHDRMTSYYLCKSIQAWFRNCERVTVDVAPTTRKYKTYGVNMLGFVHGDSVKVDSLPLLMMSECREKLAGIQHLEWHTGHLHKKKEMKFTAGDTYGPVVVRILPSLTGTDNWHYEHGFVGGLRAAEAYLWSKQNGYVGHFSATASMS